jgi:hypothetical protein
MASAAVQKSRDRLVGNLIVVIPALALLLLIARAQKGTASSTP